MLTERSRTVYEARHNAHAAIAIPVPKRSALKHPDSHRFRLEEFAEFCWPEPHCCWSMSAFDAGRWFGQAAMILLLAAVLVSLVLRGRALFVQAYGLLLVCVGMLAWAVAVIALAVSGAWEAKHSERELVREFMQASVVRWASYLWYFIVAFATAGASKRLPEIQSRCRAALNAFHREAAPLRPA